MAARRITTSTFLTLVPALLVSACVDLTPPWDGTTVPSSTGGTAVLTTGGTSSIDTGGAGGSGGEGGSSSEDAIGTGGEGGAAKADTNGVGGVGGTALDGPVPMGGNTSRPDTAVPVDVSPPKDSPMEIASSRDTNVDKLTAPELPPIVDARLLPDTADSLPSQGLVAYYSFEQATGTTVPDLSGNGNDAILRGAASIGTGKVGNGLLLTSTYGSGDAGNSGGYAELPPGLLTAARSMTIAAWFKTNGMQNYQRVFDFGTSSSTSSMYFTPSIQSGGLPNFGIRTANDAGVTTKEIIDNSPGRTVLTNGAWYYLTVVLDATGGRLYLNGIQVGSNTTMKARPSDLGMMPNDWIGRSEAPADPYFDGAIDEFRVYNRALSSTEILALFGGS